MTRSATTADVVRRLTGSAYQMTAEHALGWGMGEAQLGIDAALDAAIAAGRVEVVEVRRGVRFVRATPRIGAAGCIDHLITIRTPDGPELTACTANCCKEES